MSVPVEPDPKYKKQAIPNGVRREVCAKHGASIGVVTRVGCHYCGVAGVVDWTGPPYWPMIGELELDHVIPESKGGETSATNMVLACRPCNRSKGARF